uniref:Ral GTPase-activating protein subunit alpha/beta N-terminal domain-containing protein n=1 Tax=Romanomermis culicivorax TaxID=13658 RepID=A0A915JNZ7_ROMCU
NVILGKHQENVPSTYNVDKCRFFNQYRLEIFHLFYEFICHIEASLTGGTSHSLSSSSSASLTSGSSTTSHLPASIPISFSRSLIDLEYALAILEELLIYSPEILAKRWQYNAILTSMKKFLHPKNTLGLRRIAVRLFIIWYQIIGDDRECDAIFSSLVPHLPITVASGIPPTSTEILLQNLCEKVDNFSNSNGHNAESQTFSTSTFVFFARKNFPLAPATPRVENSQKAILVQAYFEKLLESISVEFTRFESDCKPKFVRLQFLLDKIRQFYAQRLLCDVNSEFLNGEDCFRAEQTLAPPTKSTNYFAALEEDDAKFLCAQSLTRWLALYAYNFLLSIFRFSFLISPLKYAGTLGRAFKVLREWLQLDCDLPRAFFPDEEKSMGLQNCLKCTTGVLASFFFNRRIFEDKERSGQTILICSRILSLYKYLANNAYCELSLETWTFLLRILLRIVENCVPVDEKTNDNSAVADLRCRLSPQLFQTLLVTWVLAGLNARLPDDLWSKLQETLIERRRLNFQLINEWGKVMDSLTKALALQLYEIDLNDLPSERLSEQKRKKLLAQSQFSVQPQNVDANNRHQPLNLTFQFSSPFPQNSSNDEQNNVGGGGQKILSSSIDLEKTTTPHKLLNRAPPPPLAKTPEAGENVGLDSGAGPTAAVGECECEKV